MSDSKECESSTVLLSVLRHLTSDLRCYGPSGKGGIFAGSEDTV
jgi:hypothetical protein